MQNPPEIFYSLYIKWYYWSSAKLKIFVLTLIHENLLFMRNGTFPCSDEEKPMLQSL
mgnify:CR=1 FL=1